MLTSFCSKENNPVEGHHWRRFSFDQYLIKFCLFGDGTHDKNSPLVTLNTSINIAFRIKLRESSSEESGVVFVPLSLLETQKWKNFNTQSNVGKSLKMINFSNMSR